MNDRLVLAQTGEDAAAAHLEARGYRVLSRNFRLRIGEVDVVALDPRTHETVFVEVKCRRTRLFGTPEASVHAAKLHKIARVAEAWMQRHGPASGEFRIDVVAVEFEGEKPICTHFENVTA